MSTYLITGGKLVVTYGIHEVGPSPPLPAGDYFIDLEARLPKDTPAGEYEIRLLPGSEVLLQDGSVIRPTFEGPADLTLRSAVLAGWDGGVPPLDVDADGRSVLGKVELRVTGGEGFPGDPVTLKVQMRTEVPLPRPPLVDQHQLVTRPTPAAGGGELAGQRGLEEVTDLGAERLVLGAEPEIHRRPTLPEDLTHRQIRCGTGGQAVGGFWPVTPQ